MARRKTAKETAKELGISVRTVRKYSATPRAVWLRQQAERRQAIRAYHDDEGHTWPETGEHFGITQETARRIGRRGRKEYEEFERLQPSLSLDEIA